MKKIYLFLSVAILIMCCASCSDIAGNIFANDKTEENEIDTEQRESSNDNTNTYADSEERLSFRYPDEWSEVEFTGAIVCIAAPTESDFAANMNIVKTATNNTFSATKSDFQEYYGQMFDDVEITEWVDAKINGTAAKKLIYTCTDYGVELAQEQYFYIVADDMYTITFTSLKSNYDTYAPIFESIMSSYEITGK